jgi:hypothetical protein
MNLIETIPPLVTIQSVGDLSIVTNTPDGKTTFHSSGAIIKQYEGFEVVYLTPSTNSLVAVEETALYSVSLSGGLGSALAGERAVRLHGRENVFFWFSDVQKEDHDLYRFLWDLMRRWGGRLYYFTDGRKPEDVWQKHGIIANNRMCPCSYELKVHHFRLFIKAMPHMPVVYIGYKHDESDRQKRTCTSYKNAIPECEVSYPLTWEPAETRDLAVVCKEEMGIDPPRVYALGFDYNNCGQDCCRAGIGGRVLEAIFFPDRYQKSMEWEEMMRNKGGALEGKAFCSRVVNGKKQPLSLRQILEIYVPLVRAYLASHPGQPISEKSIIRETQKWARQQAKIDAASATQLQIWEVEE